MRCSRCKKPIAGSVYKYGSGVFDESCAKKIEDAVRKGRLLYVGHLWFERPSVEKEV